MNYKRFFITASVIFVFALAWNGIVHFGILRKADSIMNTIGRAQAERSLSMSLIVTAELSLLFVWSYSKYARRGGLRDGIVHGVFFGILAGVLVDLNQYVLYPIPASLALSWFGFGMIEFCVYGMIASKLYPIEVSTAS